MAGRPQSYVQGASGGGVWRTDDFGQSWTNLSDGFFRSGSVGAVAIADRNPDLIYVGTGEGPTRGQASSEGDGLYRSADGGRTWTHIGLAATARIPRVRLHPSDPNTLYVAAQGSVWGPSRERGVYRSTDGGATWRQVLFVNERTGAADLALDTRAPRTLYAAMWEHGRTPWRITSGGAGSGIHRSSDGGETWTRLAGGLPGLIGKSGVAVSPVDSSRVWAVVEAEAGGLYRSDNGGDSWTRVSDERGLFSRSWYFMRVYAHPAEVDTVYILNQYVYRSTDGGRTFVIVGTPHVDNHDLWINPTNPAWMINGNDGGANVTLDSGRSWSTQDNQPTGQFYRVITDQRYPAYAYSAQQDNNTALAVPLRTSGDGITAADIMRVGGGESGFVGLDPRDPTLVYAGANLNQITEFDARTRQVRNVMVYPEQALGRNSGDLKYRFNWNAPIVVSRHAPGVIYHAANVLLRSTDRGHSWAPASPDLTRNQADRHGDGGGPLFNEAAGGEYYNTITYVAESPRQSGLLWVGTDDGLVHVTRDGGTTWRNVTPPGVGEYQVNAIDASPHEAGAAIVAVTGHRRNDRTPLVFRTRDYGQTWTRATQGLRANDFVRVVREDPVRPGLFYAGSESGVYVSFDAGDIWRDLQGNLPPVPVVDLIVHDGDLVAATEGRGLWVLDDLTPLRRHGSTAVSDGVVSAGDLTLLAPRPAYRMEGTGERRPGIGQNPPNGTVIWYDWRGPTSGQLTLEVLDRGGRVVRRFTSVATEGAPHDRLPMAAGRNRFVWDHRVPPIRQVPGLFLPATFFGTVSGHKVRPGQYRARLSDGRTQAEVAFEVRPDPRSTATTEDFDLQGRMLDEIATAIDALHQAVTEARGLRSQLEAPRAAAAPAAVRSVAAAIDAALESWEQTLVQPRHKSVMDVVNFPTMLNEQFLFLKGAVASADARPTVGAVARFADLLAQWQTLQRRFRELVDRDLTTLNEQLRRAGLPTVRPVR